MLKKLMLTAGFAGMAFSAMAQGKASLGIGDVAPEIKYSKWIKGTPVTSYEKDRFYVVEFWATWCGPCKTAMPHLSALAKKYKDNATFIGMNIWENTNGKPYESSLPAVIKFVNSVGSDMDYNVAADNNEQFMVKNWMEPAAQMGIPATFLIKESKVIWIGHPMALDSIMTAVMKGKYDMEAAKQKLAQSKAKAEETKAKFALLKPIQDAFSAKEYDKATKLLNELDGSDPMINTQKKFFQFNILIAQKKEAEAIAFGEAWTGEQKGYEPVVADGILRAEGFSKASYLHAAEIYKEMLKGPRTVTPLVHNKIADAYAKAGDFKAAIAEQETALTEAQEALKNKKYVGTITSDTIVQFEESLTLYKSKLK